MLNTPWLNLVGTLLTLSLGLLGFIAPHATSRLVGIKLDDPRGVSEIRATYGGLFIGLGAIALYEHDPTVYCAIGWGWMGAALARLFSLVIDQQKSVLSFGGIIVEAGIGLLLLL